MVALILTQNRRVVNERRIEKKAENPGDLWKKHRTIPKKFTSVDSFGKISAKPAKIT
jgi:hypothetical protein